ncbi:hypothetical protein D3C72_2364940 [compost metagenome]
MPVELSPDFIRATGWKTVLPLRGREKQKARREAGRVSWGGCLGGGTLLALVEELQYSGAVRVVVGIVGQGQAVARAR